MVGYPRSFLPVLWVVLVALSVSGVLLIPGAFELRWEMDVPVHLPAGWRIGVAALHALSAFLIMALLGALYAMHMRMGWRRWENISSGIATVTAIGVLALTGLGIYYIGSEQLSRWISAFHIGLGALGAVALAWHAIVGRQLRRARLGRRHRVDLAHAAATESPHAVETPGTARAMNSHERRQAARRAAEMRARQ